MTRCRSGRRLVMRGLLVYLVPADPLAHFRPGLPAQALRSGLNSLAQLSELLDSLMLPARGDQPLTITAGQGGDVGQVQGHRPPPPPVVPDDRADPAEPDRARLVTIPDRVRRAQVQHVLRVLLVQLDDLQLGEQEIRQVEGHRHPREPVLEVDGVAHVQPVDQHVQRPPGLLRLEVQLLMAVERVEGLVADVSVPGQELGQRPAIARPGREVQILAVATARRELGGQVLDRQPAGQPDGDARGGCGLADADGLFQRRRPGTGHVQHSTRNERSTPSLLTSIRYPRTTPEPASLPGLTHRVGPIFFSPPDSWMWPCRLSSGRTCCTASSTPVEPTGPRIRSPAEAWSLRFSSSTGAVSRPDP